MSPCPQHPGGVPQTLVTVRPGGQLFLPSQEEAHWGMSP